MGKGHIIIGGISFPIKDIWLGKYESQPPGINIVFDIHGPCERFGGFVTVFGQNGEGCWQGSYATLGPVPDGKIWSTTYTLTLAEILQDPDVKTVIPIEDI